MIASSLRENGQYKPLVVQRSTGFICVGNHTFQALKRIGETEGLVYFIDVDDTEAYKILLADNRASDVSGYDKKGLVADLEAFFSEVGSLSGTLWKENDIAKLKGTLPDVSDGSLLALTKVTMGEPSNTVSHGDVWLLGDKVILVVAEVLTEHHLWKGLLDIGDVFVPYPGMYAAVSDVTKRAGKVVMVQPNHFIAGHIIDRYKEINPKAEVKRK